MVPGEDVCSIGLEYFCRTGDEFWNKSDDALIELGKKEMERLRLVDIEDVFDAFVIRCDKAYPVYLTGYHRHLERVRNCVDGISNLQCIGRNGMFKYNNMDHSILAGLLAVDNIFGDTNDLWAVNTDDEYHEEKRETA